MIIFEAAEREIRAKGLNPAKITYEQVVEGIEKLKEQRKSVQTEYRSLSKDLKQQLEMMKEYLDKNENINTNERKRRDHIDL